MGRRRSQTAAQTGRTLANQGACGVRPCITTPMEPRCPAFLALPHSVPECRCPRKGVISGDRVLQQRPIPWGPMQGSKTFLEAGSVWSVSTQVKSVPSRAGHRGILRRMGQGTFSESHLYCGHPLCASLKAHGQGQAILADNPEVHLPTRQCAQLTLPRWASRFSTGLLSLQAGLVVR